MVNPTCRCSGDLPLSAATPEGRVRRGSATEQLLDFVCKGGHFFTGVKITVDVDREVTSIASHSRCFWVPFQLSAIS